MSDFNDGLLPTPCLRMDTHFGDEYESIEFGDGTGYIKAAPILAKVGALHEEIDRLRDESAELRELVRHMHTCLEHYEPGDTISCEQCPYDNETWGCDYERLMAELGIEVEV